MRREPRMESEQDTPTTVRIAVFFTSIDTKRVDLFVETSAIVQIEADCTVLPRLNNSDAQKTSVPSDRRQHARADTTHPLAHARTTL